MMICVEPAIMNTEFKTKNYPWAKIPSVTDASAPRFHQCSPNYKYQQLLSFMAVQDKFGLCFGQKIEA